MCGRITVLTYEELRSVADAVERHAGQAPLLDPELRAQRSQARPASEVHALKPQGTHLEIAPFTWGFPLKDGKKLVFNTRIESALEGSPLWARALREGRCILPVASFFEPHATELSTSPKTGRPVKRQYEFTGDDDRAPLLLAGVGDGGRLSIVTTEPNAHVAPIHPRMPLVLRFEEVEAWLYGNYNDFAALADRSRVSLAAQPETPMQPASAGSAPTQPDPTHPGPAHPGPAHPGPAQPAPAQPAPTQLSLF